MVVEVTDYIVIKVKNGACPECGWVLLVGHHPNCPIGRLDYVVADDSCVQLIAEDDTLPAHVAHPQQDSD